MTTATVETLTAEVRTLMVGSRQVTLSMAKQLDVVSLADLKVMGRLNLRFNARDLEMYVIGAKVSDSSLALATYDPYLVRSQWVDAPQWWELNQAAKRAPLIVLAGLK
jgi:hypothetical protein